MGKFRKFKLTFEQEYYDENGQLVKAETPISIQDDIQETNFNITDKNITEDYLVRNYLDHLANNIKMELITRKK